MAHYFSLVRITIFVFLLPLFVHVLPLSHVNMYKGESHSWKPTWHGMTRHVTGILKLEIFRADPLP